MNADILFFFSEHLEALPLYEDLERQILSSIENVTIKVQKTQISFSNRHNFAFVSFLPARKAKDRPKTWLTVTFGLPHRVESPRIDAAVEPYPNRWTHHLLLSQPGQVDQVVLEWLAEAYRFSFRGRRGR